LGGSCVPVRFDGSGADDRFRSKNCGIDFERAPCALRERIWGGAAGRCGATMQAGALPGESEPEWRWSMRWRIDGADIMRGRERKIVDYQIWSLPQLIDNLLVMQKALKEIRAMRGQPKLVQAAGMH